MLPDTRLRVGQTLSPAHGPGRFVVLRTGTAGDMPTLGGRPLVEAPPLPCSAAGPRSPGDLAPGARYADEETGLELRCTEASAGRLRYAGRPMTRLPDEPRDLLADRSIFSGRRVLSGERR